MPAHQENIYEFDTTIISLIHRFKKPYWYLKLQCAAWWFDSHHSWSKKNITWTSLAVTILNLLTTFLPLKPHPSALFPQYWSLICSSKIPHFLNLELLFRLVSHSGIFYSTLKLSSLMLPYLWSLPWSLRYNSMPSLQGVPISPWCGHKSLPIRLLCLWWCFTLVWCIYSTWPCLKSLNCLTQP